MPIDLRPPTARPCLRAAVRRAWRFAAALLAACLAVPAFADPPARVGRLAQVHGGVWVLDAGSGEWLSAPRNLPVTGGSRIATDADGRAEIGIGPTALRLDGAGDIEVLRLDDASLRLRLHRGSLAVRLRGADAAEGFELHAGDGRVSAATPGHFRIDRDEGVDRVTAWQGDALLQLPELAVPVPAGERADVWRDAAGRPMQPLRVRPAADAFRAWALARDAADEAAWAQALHHVPSGMTGAEDLQLDAYGAWETVPEIGAVWLPRGVAAGWAPYRDGRWAWIEPWGWTWVDAAPWGFAPFHYGRWLRLGERWAWSPGERSARPVYAPALVAWTGSGATVGGRPTVGWYPLAPGEPFVPGYRASPRHLREVNLPHVADPARLARFAADPDAALRGRPYRLRDTPSAWTVVPATVLGARQPVAPAALSPAATSTGDEARPARGGRGGDAAARSDRPGGATGAAARAGEGWVAPPPPPAAAASGGIRGPLPGGTPRRGGPDIGPTSGGAAGTGGLPGVPQPQPQQRPQEVIEPGVRGPLPGGTPRRGGPDIGPTSGGAGGTPGMAGVAAAAAAARRRTRSSPASAARCPAARRGAAGPTSGRPRIREDSLPARRRRRRGCRPTRRRVPPRPGRSPRPRPACRASRRGRAAATTACRRRRSVPKREGRRLPRRRQDVPPARCSGRRTASAWTNSARRRTCSACWNASACRTSGAPSRRSAAQEQQQRAQERCSVPRTSSACSISSAASRCRRRSSSACRSRCSSSSAASRRRPSAGSRRRLHRPAQAIRATSTCAAARATRATADARRRRAGDRRRTDTPLPADTPRPRSYAMTGRAGRRRAGMPSPGSAAGPVAARPQARRRSLPADAAAAGGRAYLSSGPSTGQTLSSMRGCAAASGWMRSLWNIASGSAPSATPFSRNGTSAAPSLRATLAKPAAKSSA